MGKASGFYFKIITRNILFLLIVISSLFFSLATREVVSKSIAYFSVTTTFGLICSTVGMIFLCTYISGKKYDVLDYIENNKFKRFLGILLASIKAISLIYLANVIIILLGVNFNNSLVFNIKGFIHFSVIWYIANVFAILIGLSVGIFLSNFSRYIVCLLLITPFINKVRGMGMEGSFNNLINILDDKLISPRNYAVDIIFNNFYILDKLFIILFMIFIILIVYIYTSKKSCKYIVLLIPMLLILQYTVLNLADTNMFIINSSNYEEKKENNKVTNKELEYFVKEYDMNLNLDSKLQNKCKMKIHLNSDKINKINFSLDKIFDIKSIYVNNKDTNYKREGNNIEVPVKEFNFTKNQEVDILVEYSGQVYGTNNVGTDSVYVSYTAVNLINDINWYPVMSKDIEFNFKVKGNSTSEIYSNLDFKTSKKGRFSYGFNIDDIGKELVLVSGNYDRRTYKGIDVIIPKAISSDKNINNIINDQLVNISNVDLSKSDINNIKNKKYKKLLVTSGSSIYLRYDKDTVIIDIMG